MSPNKYSYGRDKLPPSTQVRSFRSNEPSKAFLDDDTSKAFANVVGHEDPLMGVRIPRRAIPGETIADHNEVLFRYRSEKEAANPDLSLIDEWMAGTYGLPKAVKKYMRHSRKRLEKVEQDCIMQRSLIKRSARFTLDDEFVEMATRVAGTASPEKMKQMTQMATLPYEVTYLELNLHVKVRTSATLAGYGDEYEIHSTVPKRLGLLLKRDMTRPTSWAMFLIGPLAFREGDIEEHVTTLPGVYLFDADETGPLHKVGAAGQAPFISRNAIGIENVTPVDIFNGMRAMSWGYSFAEVTDSALEEKVGETFRKLGKKTPPMLEPHSSLSVNAFYQAVLDCLPERASTTELNNMIQSWFMDFSVGLKENSGILRWVVTVLAMLNEVPTTSNHVVKPGSQRIGLHHKNLLDHHRLSLKLPKTRPIQFIERKLRHAIAAKKRAHEVRSHWRTYQTELSCKPADHKWEYDHSAGYRLCEICESYGRLIPEHIRGDETLGWVRKDYVLEANPEAK